MPNLHENLGGNGLKVILILPLICDFVVDGCEFLRLAIGVSKALSRAGCFFLFMTETPRIREAIDPHPRGVLIRFDVAPGSTSLLVPTGFNPWRKALEAKLTEKPTKGKANLQLERALAEIFGIGADRVQVAAGLKSSRKVVLVIGVDADEAERKLAGKESSTP